MTPNPLRDVISAVQQCSDGKTDCYVVDDGAVIVYSESAGDEVRRSHSISSKNNNDINRYNNCDMTILGHCNMA